MTLAPSHESLPEPRPALTRFELPPLPGRTLAPEELLAWVRRLAEEPELWRHHLDRRPHRAAVRTDEAGRHYVSLYRDAEIDVWLLCWDTTDDTGWHDHDTSSGAVAVVEGAVRECRPRLGGDPVEVTATAGASFAFGPDHIHRMSGAVDGSVSIHAYSPPLWRMGQYSVDEHGTLRRWSISYADELRPLDPPDDAASGVPGASSTPALTVLTGLSAT